MKYGQWTGAAQNLTEFLSAWTMGPQGGRRKESPPSSLPLSRSRGATDRSLTSRRVAWHSCKPLSGLRNANQHIGKPNQRP